jgi:cytidylate kinase
LRPTVGLNPEEVIRDLRARDERDSNRADSPLKPAEDSVLLDSSHMTLDEVLLAAEAIVTATLSGNCG